MNDVGLVVDLDHCSACGFAHVGQFCAELPDPAIIQGRLCRYYFYCMRGKQNVYVAQMVENLVGKPR